MEENMSVGAVQTGASYTDYEYDAAKKNTKVPSEDKNAAGTEAGAVYESSAKDAVKTSGTTTKTSNSALVSKMKADAQNRLDQMQSLVETMFKKQGIAIGTADDMWKKLASGNFTADADTIAQAKKDVAEDGYWGVSQTSDRIFDFAMALSGGDEDKMKDMLEAVKKGFSQATKSWGRDLPDISGRTYDAVMQKFDDYFNKDKNETDAGTVTEKTAAVEA